MSRPKKYLGQHFLHDSYFIQKLVAEIKPVPGEHVVEIGPGPGALTVPMLQALGQMDVVEIDQDLLPGLRIRCQPFGQLNIYQADALTFDFAQLDPLFSQPLRVIGNLPYNISTPLIFHLLRYVAQIKDMHFMLQKEVVERLAAKVNSKAYGRLSVMVQYHCHVQALFNVPATAFHPPPQVESSIVRLSPYQQLPHTAVNYMHFAQLTKAAFCQRRKVLRNSLKEWVSAEIWSLLGLDQNARPETFSVGDFVKLSNAVSAQVPTARIKH